MTSAHKTDLDQKNPHPLRGVILIVDRTDKTKIGNQYGGILGELAQTNVLEALRSSDIPFTEITSQGGKFITGLEITGDENIKKFVALGGAIFQKNIFNKTSFHKSHSVEHQLTAAFDQKVLNSLNAHGIKATHVDDKIHIDGIYNLCLMRLCGANFQGKQRYENDMDRITLRILEKKKEAPDKASADEPSTNTHYHPNPDLSLHTPQIGRPRD